MKIVHTSDLHFGVTKHTKRTGGLDAKTEDLKRSARFMAEKAVEEEVNAIVIAGDVFDSTTPTPTHVMAFIEAIQPARDAGISVVIVPGDHEMPETQGLSHAPAPLDGLNYVTVLDTPGDHEVQTPDGTLSVLALPYPRRHLLGGEDAGTLYKRLIRTSQAELIVGHFIAVGCDPAGSEEAVSLSRKFRLNPDVFESSAAKYVALGDIHRAQDLSGRLGPPVVYSGAIERITFNEEGQAKGFVIVDLDDAENYRFIETPARPFVTIDADLRESANPTADMLARIDDAELEGAVVRVRYQLEEGQQLDVREVQKALRPGIHKLADFAEVRPERESRTRGASGISKTSTLREALEGFCEVRDEFASLKEEMISKALQLQRQL